MQERSLAVKAKVLFMGTASFSKAVLEKLIENEYDIIGVVTQPDRIVGRKKVLTYPEVKEVALEHDIPVFQPENIKKEYEDILELKPDIVITAAYGQIIPEPILEMAPLKAINVHASLLPQYRGGAPVHQAIIDGNAKTGVTIMYMVKKMDAGNIISQAAVDIGPDETTGELYDRLSVVGAQLLIDTLPSIVAKTNDSIVQDEAMVSYAPVITRAKEFISFENHCQVVCNLVRGLNPWPGGFARFQDQNIKIWNGRCQMRQVTAKPGEIVEITKDGIGVACLDGVYFIEDIQIPGKKRMKVKDYLNGKSIFDLGDCFDSRIPEQIR